MKDLYNTLAQLLEQGRSAVLATIIRQEGPSPREMGTRCLILEDGTCIGTIGGGVLEARTVATAGRVFDTNRPERLFFSLEGVDVAESDMLCGGQVEVFLEPVSPASSVCLTLYREVSRTVTHGKRGLMATVMDPEAWIQGPPPRLFLTETGTPYGSLPQGEKITETLIHRMDAWIRAKQTVLIPLKNDAGTPVQILVEPLGAHPSLYVFGAGHVSKQIVPLAHRVGFRVTVIDDRDDFADKRLFPEARQVLCLPFEAVMEPLKVDRFSYLVIVTRGHIHDHTVLAQSLLSPAAYIGMIGSHRKRDIIYRKLMEQGFTRQDLARVYSPVGLDIGAQTPEEIAVSIVAQLIQVRAGRLKWPSAQK
ncbi:MAG: XdhC family protein [Desulfatiglandaceae bacterium]